MLNAYLARKRSIRNQFISIKKIINNSIHQGADRIILNLSIKDIWSEILVELNNKGFDVFYTNSLDLPIIMISWENGKKANGIRCGIDEDKIIQFISNNK